jgi:hypothetical protein
MSARFIVDQRPVFHARRDASYAPPRGRMSGSSDGISACIQRARSSSVPFLRSGRTRPLKHKLRRHFWRLSEWTGCGSSGASRSRAVILSSLRFGNGVSRPATVRYLYRAGASVRCLSVSRTRSSTVSWATSIRRRAHSQPAAMRCRSETSGTLSSGREHSLTIERLRALIEPWVLYPFLPGKGSHVPPCSYCEESHWFDQSTLIPVSLRMRTHLV